MWIIGVLRKKGGIFLLGHTRKLPRIWACVYFLGQSFVDFVREGRGGIRGEFEFCYIW